MYAIVVETRRGVSEKTQRPYHMFELVAQDEDGNVGKLKHFLKDDEMARPDWAAVRAGDVLEVEVEQRRSGLNTYQNVRSAKISAERAAIGIV